MSIPPEIAIYRIGEELRIETVKGRTGYANNLTSKRSETSCTNVKSSYWLCIARTKICSSQFTFSLRLFIAKDLLSLRENTYLRTLVPQSALQTFDRSPPSPTDIVVTPNPVSAGCSNLRSTGSQASWAKTDDQMSSVPMPSSLPVQSPPTSSFQQDYGAWSIPARSLNAPASQGRGRSASEGYNSLYTPY